MVVLSIIIITNLILISNQSLGLSDQSLLNLPGSLPLLLQLLLYLCDVVAGMHYELSMSHLLQLIMYHTLIHCSTPPF